MILKRYIALVLFLIPLMSAGCDSDINDIGNETITIKKTPISISIPKAWREIKQTDLKELEKDTFVAYASLNYINGFANSISITTELISPETTSLQYAHANIINSSRFLSNYTKIIEKDIMIKNDDETTIASKLHIFEAQFDMTTPQRKYVQLYAVKGAIGYTITMTISAEEQDTSKYENLVTSFRFIKE